MGVGSVKKKVTLLENVLTSPQAVTIASGVSRRVTLLTTALMKVRVLSANLYSAHTNGRSQERIVLIASDFFRKVLSTDFVYTFKHCFQWWSNVQESTEVQFCEMLSKQSIGDQVFLFSAFKAVLIARY